MSLETALALARGGLLLAEALVFGTLVVRVLAGTAAPAFPLRAAWWALAALGTLWIVLQALAIADAGSMTLVLTETRVGNVALLRVAFWLLAALLSSHRIAALPAAVAMALHGAAGHATADGDTLLQAAVLAHVLAAGAWIGGLPALWAGLSNPSAATLVRRYANLGFACVGVLAATAIEQGLAFAGGLPGLLGTTYGHLLLIKLALFAGLLILAARNRFMIQQDHARLRRSVAMEALLGLATLLAASLLSATPPGAHEQPWWPFPWRPDTSILADDDLRAEVLQGVAQLAGAALLLAMATFPHRLRLLWVVASAAIITLAVPHLTLLLVPAEPTVFWQAPGPPTPVSIALGREAYAANCASCHGASYRGDGPLARTLPIPPADLTAPHLWDHPDGQLYWWLTDGMRGPDGTRVMPGFPQLDERTRWALIDFIRSNNPNGVATGGVHQH